MEVKSNIQHILFDLDNTLWDFAGNSERILKEIYTDMQLASKGITDFHAFHKQYIFRNEALWYKYAMGEVSRDDVRLNRFRYTLHDFGVDDYVLATQAADHYITHTRNQKQLLPYAAELLQYLQKKYTLHVITNGFNEVQFFKLKNCGLDAFFDTVTTAETAQSLKPDAKIFQHALQQIPAAPEHCLYIGDSPETDGQGATGAGLQFIWFNPDGRENTYGFHEVKTLEEIERIL
ncbi:MAG: YjjG family noncanonical pyrimidine nucleotidase [Chitinophagales bacterium]